MLTRLEARHFRNLAPLAWTPGAGRHLLLGGNGAGKTSLLEAVYAIATTRSFRTPRLAECVRHGEERFRLAAEVEDDARVHLELAWGGGGLERAVNGTRGPLAEHLGVLPVVAWTTTEAEVLTGPPARRRRFLDRGVVSSRAGSLEALRRYREALRHKRDLLVDGGGSPRPPARSSASSLAAWNRVLAEGAAAVAALRGRYAERLDRTLTEVLREIERPFPKIELRYRPSPACSPEGTAAIEERLQRVAAAERLRRMPLIGPHRDELEILWAGRPISEVASAGETKALSVALIAAHGRVVEGARRTPIYLLDDLDAELDPETLAALWPLFSRACQVLASSNRPTVWEGLQADSCWSLRTGELTEQLDDPPPG